MGRLDGKVALIFGAGSSGPGWGNGRATATLFAREGASVLAVDISETSVRQTAETIQAEGFRCEIAVADVTSEAEVGRAVEACIKHFGRVDILHNNVGIHHIGGPLQHSEADWDRVVATNLKSLFLTCRQTLPLMEAQGSGAVVNVGSISGARHMGTPTLAYTTSKGAVLSFTRSIAVQYGPAGIRANVVTPGSIDTPLLRGASEGGSGLHASRRTAIPLRRLGSAWDVAEAGLFLASDAAAYITGSELVVDGGLSCVAVADG